MTIKLINPSTQKELNLKDDCLEDEDGNKFEIYNGIPRFCEKSNYVDSFGFQWNKFDQVQLDNECITLSKDRFFGQTGWSIDELDSRNILEVGSGAGRFSKVVLENTNAKLYSVDFSNAVDANLNSNGKIKPENFYLYQASVYELPFEKYSFDYVFCLGVIQHTPDPDKTIKCLVDMLKPGGKICIDFYLRKGWWTKFNAKYLLRPITTRISHQKLLRFIEIMIPTLINIYDFFHLIRLGVLTRFLPITELKSFPPELSKSERKELAILDTFDMFSPAFDEPQSMDHVVNLLSSCGIKVSHAGPVNYKNDAGTAIAVRGIKS